jgi:hypothetical protein
VCFAGYVIREIIALGFYFQSYAFAGWIIPNNGNIRESAPFSQLNAEELIKIRFQEFFESRNIKGELS